MKTSNTLTALCWLVALLALIYAGAGLFWQDNGSPFPFTTLHGQAVQINGQGVYHFDTVFGAAGNRGTDATTLFVALPLFVTAILLYQRGSRKGALLLVGVLSYFLYNAVTMAFGVAYNQLVFVYIAAFSTSLFTFILTCTKLDLPTLPALALPGMPHRGIAAFLCFTGIATALIWLSDMLPAMAQGKAPAVLASYTTVFTYTFDLAVITPATVMAGVLLLKRKPLGYLLSPVLMILCTLVGAAVIGQTIFQLNAGISFSPGQFIGLIGSWVVMGIIAIVLTTAFFKNFSPARTSSLTSN